MKLSRLAAPEIDKGKCHVACVSSNAKEWRIARCGTGTSLASRFDIFDHHFGTFEYSNRANAEVGQLEANLRF